ncbi:PREDICTED: mas-related G-protein coupled receptor member X1-like [Haliaeetus leucocephalus]|uniref:mas-related G-protein coupled receptor member X1-like n=1 Tax=Haliaeetus leucocephalus TaxID=52644 RepID=UPI00053CC7CA|nr:PREDICTED: mas-related G-protein coupled receptor member X1-like [Haliaeetus leucocephalus]
MSTSATSIFLPTATSQAHGTNQSVAVEKTEASYAVLKFMESFCLISAVCGMVGNGIVLWYLGFRIRRNHFTVYIVNLAAADFGYLLCIAVETVQYLMQFNVGVQFGPFLFLDLFMYGTGFCRLLLIAIGALDFVFCTPLMLLFSLTLFLRVKCSSQKLQTGRLFTVIMLTILFFLIFAVPLGVLIFFDFLGYKFLYSPEIGFVLSCVNSSLNPVIYFLVGSYRERRIKFTLRLAFQRAFEDSADDKEERETRDTITMSS